MGWEYAVVIAGAGLAGWIDAIIGGGGLILIPLIMTLFPGIAPVMALGTNKLAGFSGTCSAAVRLSPHAAGFRKQLYYLVPIAAISSGVAALAATGIPAAVMRPVVIVLLLAVGLFVALRPKFGAGEAAATRTPGMKPALSALAVAGIAAYDGVFGPGTGMFLLVALIATLGANFVTATAVVKCLNAATNLAALIIFATAGQVWWQLGICLAIANIIGAQIGARTLIRGGTGFIRAALLCMVVVMCGVLGWQQWLS